MGMFDYIRCIGPEFVCSRGHSLADEEFQTKDFSCELAWHKIENGVLSFYDGAVTLDPAFNEVGQHGIYGQRPDAQRPYLGYIFVYCSCHQCPSFVYGQVGSVASCWCEFKVRIVDNKVEMVERIAEDFDEFAQKQAGLPDTTGPIPTEEAIKIASQRMRAWAAGQRGQR